MADTDSTTTRWDGYSDYQTVSQRITQSIHDAIEAYATVDRAHRENARLDPEQAAQAGSQIMSAAISVQTELGAYKDQNDEYADLYDEFAGDDGYVQKLHGVALRSECPDWLFEFVVDIRRAGFQLGYLQAGREQTETDDSPEGEAKQMFADL